MRIIFTGIVLFFFANLSAQERKILQGQITNDSLIASVHIVNITSEKGVLSDFSGEFSIAAKEGDSILFSSIQYKKKIIAITPVVVESGKIIVKLQEELTELDEVQLHNLSGNLGDDIENIETVNLSDFGIPYSDRKPPSIVSRKLSAISSPMNPVGLIYGAISGERKKLKLALENERLNNKILKARNLISEDFFQKELKLKEENVLDFLYFCAENPRFLQLVHQKEQLALIEMFYETIDDYRKFKSLD